MKVPKDMNKNILAPDKKITHIRNVGTGGCERLVITTLRYIYHHPLDEMAK